MKKILTIVSLGLLCASIGVQHVHAQSFIKKIKKKAEDAAIEKMFEDEKQTNDQPSKTVYSSGNEHSPSNTRGGGLSASSPDVMSNIDKAESSFNKKEYSDARFAVRQAILGIEMEIGGNVLQSLPESISGLPVVESEDQVTSSGIGFVGLIIQRVYRDGDREMRITIANDAAMISAANMYLASGAYATSSQDQNVKQTTFKDHRAVIEYDENSGYQLSVPFGQSSILVFYGINYKNEDEFMTASEEVDIENMKTQLGEK